MDDIVRDLVEIVRWLSINQRQANEKIERLELERDKHRDAAYIHKAEIERLRITGDTLARYMAMEHYPEDCDDDCESLAAWRAWQEARRGRSEATEIVETMLEAGMEW